MKIKAIILANLPNRIEQAEYLYGFIQANLRSEGVRASTLWLATEESDTRLLASQTPTQKVDLLQVSGYQVETILKVLQTFEAAGDTDLYLLPFGALADDIAVRWAYRSNGSSLVQVKGVDCSETGVRAQKSVYANHVSATFRMVQKPCCFSLAKDGIEAQRIPIRKNVTVVEHDLSDLRADHPINSEWIPTESTQDLEKTRFLVVGGRGMGSAAACRELEQIASSLGADFGVSRPVAMGAWAPLHRLVGVSGAIAKPQVCIAAAVSGAPAFYAGIARSKKIIAINKDNQAPITKAADVVIVDDYKAIMRALEEIGKQEKSKGS